ncbi:MAG: rod shape-determining protein RodA [Methylicorpusculum sp.]|uniref:rod shape-determining protein RodA n=1 Tax=Methylicorpusculum sp. TaxID=2713644 RepID=UPI002725C07E|nr:rod shape-determining protein RodA [Methylicorpusculum sp.]MDO8843704.1 rod shape-determining protein RodA [Methylicorpusculum sp.]MDO8941287.1 rod shape-determining protein RodA [Methylicorpusculum sp.]MDO9238609.1 rod shape-determining protein RodA [Methylicorpusculum sp.]MDP2180197.1 rod shape-determining protein RodA [Methylicorpusculum sp.]MDP2204248.1 rod shape-determining protein RodA [Methylicorpusculum sp.]
MKTELRSEQLDPPSLIGDILRKLHIDVPLLAGLLMVTGLSFLVLYSASGQDIQVLVRQGARIGAAFVLMTVLAHINPYQFKRHSLLLYGIGVALLIAVLIMGEIGKGAQRWLDLGFFRFQPSEMLKITTPMMIAWYLSETALPPKWKQLGIAGLYILIPTLLIAKQPDLGTSILVASSGAAVIYFAGLSWKFIISVTIVMASLTPVLWHFMRDYQRDRVLTFLNPEADPMGRGYHIIQSKIAIGSGGLYGKGWQGSTQSQLDFLPESSTDFIFAVFAEEFGLIGCIVLLLIYLAIICRCLYIALQAQDTYCRLLAGSLSFTFFVYVFVNMGMVIGILPVVGVPLPLVSYGGTSMITLLAGFGILMSIHTHKKFLAS